MQKNNINTSLSAVDHSINSSLPKLPLVSICCVTYNHAPFIRKCLDGFLMQSLTPSSSSTDDEGEYDWNYEIIIGDDCSTDGTKEICETYAEEYAGVIRFLPAEINMGALKNEERVIAFAKGKYLAFCEGDDFWTDAKKLQKQVDFLENHAEYVACYHRFCYFDEKLNEYRDDNARMLFPQNEMDSLDVTWSLFYSSWVTQYLTCMCRRSCYDLSFLKMHGDYCDTHQAYMFLKSGKVSLLNIVAGAYRITGEGVYTGSDLIKRYNQSIEQFEILARINNDDMAASYCCRLRQDMIYQCKNLGKVDLVKNAFLIFKNNRNFKKLFRNIIKVL